MKSKNFFQPESDLHSENKHLSNLAFQFKVLLEKNFRSLHLVKEHAKILSVTSDSLNEATKKGLGKNASDLITDRIILEAKRLLSHSALDNKQIAYYLNYEDPSYFSRYFKNQLGLSPSDFRKKHFKKDRKSTRLNSSHRL